ncbi:polysaccharide pyruvyl transferase family protein [Sphingobacterium kyonggiense]
MRKINLIYWNSKNFGDLLNPWLIRKISLNNVQYKRYEPSFTKRILIISKYLFQFKFKKFLEVILPWEKTLICIGSIISWSNKNSTIWGPGFMNENEKFNGGKIKAVRGHFTRDKLIKNGFNCPNVLGDPALLIPLVFKDNFKRNSVLGIIPHWREVDYFISKYGKNHKIIDLRTDDIDGVIGGILSCKYILSTSLHGLIVPHAYNIPAIWIKKNYIDTDGFKFKDYFSSVDIDQYEGFEDFHKLLIDENELINFFNNNISKSQIQNNLKETQISLLSSFPFNLKEEYKSLLDKRSH